MWTCRKNTKSRRALFCPSGSNHREKNEILRVALDSRKLNESCKKLRPNMPNMQKLISQKPTKIRRAPDEPEWISKIDLEHAYSQLKLPQETNNRCNFSMTGGKLTGYFRFKRGFYGLSDTTTILQKKARTLNYQTPVWLDDKTKVTKRNKDKHRKKLSKD